MRKTTLIRAPTNSARQEVPSDQFSPPAHSEPRARHRRSYRPFGVCSVPSSPNAPNPNSPHRIGDPEPTVGEKHPGDPQNLSEMRLEVQKLQDMVSERKEELDHTNPNTTLSVSFVKKTQQIEKLAKQLKDRPKS